MAEWELKGKTDSEMKEKSKERVGRNEKAESRNAKTTERPSQQTVGLSDGDRDHQPCSYYRYAEST